MVQVLIQQLPTSEGLELPHYATEHSAGMDLVAAIDQDQEIKPHETMLVKTGIAIALPDGYEAQIRPRSGLALKHGITVLNTPGTIDADYRGEIGVILTNHSKTSFIVTRGMRIAQMVINQYVKAELVQASELPSTERGEGGFGSTGLKTTTMVG